MVKPIAIIGILAGVFLAAYSYRFELLLTAVNLAIGSKSVNPHEEILWNSPEEEEKRDGRPNVVLIVADDLGWNDLTFNGGGVAGGLVPTPNIDSIAKEGILFKNGYSASGTCAPSRAALMTGLYPTRVGFEFTPTPPFMSRYLDISNKAFGPGLPGKNYFDRYDDSVVPHFREMGLPTEEVTLAERFKEAGYYTAHIGKWHLGRENGMSPNQQGFVDSLTMESGLYLPKDDPEVVNSVQPWDPIDKFLWAALQHSAVFNDGEAFEPGGYLTDYWTKEAIKVIENNRNRPFFLYFAHWAVHNPLQALKEDYDSLEEITDHRLRVYAAMVKSLDRSVGKVLEALKKNGLEENTLVMFTSDNGGPGYIGLPEINDPFRGWKISFFEGGIHVPFFIKWPKEIAEARIYKNPVHHMDLAATALAAAGVQAEGLDGVDLLPHVTNEDNSSPHETLFWRGGHYEVVLKDGWKLQRMSDPEKTWLFNLNEDPTEQNNLVQENPELVSQLIGLLETHNASQKQSIWPAMINAPILIDKTSDIPFEEGDEYVYWMN